MNHRLEEPNQQLANTLANTLANSRRPAARFQNRAGISPPTRLRPLPTALWGVASLIPLFRLLRSSTSGATETSAPTTPTSSATGARGGGRRPPVDTIPKTNGRRLPEDRRPRRDTHPLAFLFLPLSISSSLQLAPAAPPEHVSSDPDRDPFPSLRRPPARLLCCFPDLSCASGGSAQAYTQPC